MSRDCARSPFRGPRWRPCDERTARAAEQYLQLRSELGYKMHRVTRMLRSFVAFAEQEGAADITTDLALRWAQQPSGAQPTTWACA